MDVRIVARTVSSFDLSKEDWCKVGTVRGRRRVGVGGAQVLSEVHLEVVRKSLEVR